MKTSTSLSGLFRSLLACVAGAGGIAFTLAPGHAVAQAAKPPLRIISTFPAGIVPDASTRLMADHFTQQTGRTVIIEAKPGGNGLIAISALKQSPADGNTLLLVSNAHLAIIPALVPNLPYDVERDFVPVATTYRAPFFLAVPADSKHTSVGQLIAHAKSAPRVVSYSIPYTGAPTHLGMATLELLSGTTMLPVPYKDGGVMAVAKGEVDFTMMAMGSARPLIESGRVRLLAAALPERSSLMPDLPTIEEAGGPKGVKADTYVGFVALQGTPPELVRQLNEQIGRALQTPELAPRFRQLGVNVLVSAPDQMKDLIREDAKATRLLVQRTGIKAD